MPREARLYSVEFNAANAEIARRILAHAGVDAKVTVIVGTLGDGGETIRTLKREHNFVPGSLDLVFLDHDKKAYLSDLELIVDAGWLHPGSVVVADNILVPGAPAYRAHMRHNDGTLWHTTEHRSHAEYQSVIRIWCWNLTTSAPKPQALVPADLNVDPSSPGRRDARQGVGSRDPCWVSNSEGWASA